MNIGPVNTAEIPIRGSPAPGFAWQANELYDVFSPIIGANAVLVYATLTRKSYPGQGFAYSTRELARSIDRSAPTVSRCLRVLEYVGMVRLKRGRGSKRSECELTDLRELARRLGSPQTRSGASCPLPDNVAESLMAEIRALRRQLSGKREIVWEPAKNTNSGEQRSGGNLFLPVAQRNTGVSLVTRQRCAGETPAGSHLIQQNTIPQKTPTPTPTPNQDGEAQKGKNSPDKDEPDGLLRWAQVKFTGVMKDVGSHLLDSSKPPSPHLANGAADWQEFGFNSLAVEAAAKRGEVLGLVLSASDPAAARRGLDKYHRIWRTILRKWYECPVHVELQQAKHHW